MSVRVLIAVCFLYRRASGLNFVCGTIIVDFIDERGGFCWLWTLGCGLTDWILACSGCGRRVGGGVSYVPCSVVQNIS